MTELEARLGYAFKDATLLTRALTHRSYAADHNERLEFVGDGVLNCVIAAALYERFPRLPEGDLSRLRANLVGVVLNEVHREISPGYYYSYYNRYSKYYKAAAEP